MALENSLSPNDRRFRLEHEDDEIFRKTYLELKASAEYAKEHFSGFPIYNQLQEEIKKYAPRFNLLSSPNQTTQGNTSQ